MPRRFLSSGSPGRESMPSSAHWPLNQQHFHQGCGRGERHRPVRVDKPESKLFYIMYRARLTLALLSAHLIRSHRSIIYDTGHVCTTYILRTESSAQIGHQTSAMEASDAKCSLKPHQPSRVNLRYLIVGVIPTRSY